MSTEASVHARAVEAPVSEVGVHAYTVPTSTPESDGALAWDSTTIVVVGIEPSCVAAFRDELPGLMPHDEDAKRLSLQTLTLAELLQRHAPDWQAPHLDATVVVHGHCHQKAGTAALARLASRR